MTREQKGIIIFDVDGTLATLNSWVEFSKELAKHYKLDEQQIRIFVSIHYKLYKKFRLFLNEPRTESEIEEEWKKTEKKLFELWNLFEDQQLTKQIIKKIVIKIVKKFLENNLKNLFDELKKAGYTIYLVSASFTEFIEALAKELEVEGFANSKFDLSDPDNPKLKYHPDEDGRKLAQILNIIEKNEINLDEDKVWVIDDKPGIELVQREIAKMILVGTSEQNEFIHAVIQEIQKVLDVLEIENMGG